jgi:hypothetical protein
MPEYSTLANNLFDRSPIKFDDRECICLTAGSNALCFVCFVYEEDVMTRMWKIAALALFAAVSIASPALAHGARTGHHHGYVASRHSRGYGAFAMVPRTYAHRYSPAANGGGSSGYNWAVENDQ